MTDKNDLDALSICSIMEACSEFGVTEFIFGDLRILFGKQTKEMLEIQTSSTTAAPDSVEINPQLEQKALEQAEVLTKEDQLELMKIENPTEFEDLIVSGELEDGELPREEE